MARLENEVEPGGEFVRAERLQKAVQVGEEGCHLPLVPYAALVVPTLECRCVLQ